MGPWKQNAHQERDTNVSLFLPLGVKERFWRKSSVSRQSRVHQLFFRCSRPNYELPLLITSTFRLGSKSLRDFGSKSSVINIQVFSSAVLFV